MLKNDAIYNSLFRFRNINLNNINDIYFVIDIIIVIATTFLKAFIIIIFIFNLDIVIIINVDIVIIIVIFKKFVIKFIAFGSNIKRRLIMNISFDKF